MKNEEKISLFFMIFSYLIILIFIIIFPSINILIKLALAIISFFTLLGLSIVIYETLSNREEYDHDIQREFIKSPNYTRRLKDSYSKNKHKKHRKKYHEKRVSKMYRRHKGLITKKEYYAKRDLCAATQYGGWYLLPP